MATAEATNQGGLERLAASMYEETFQRLDDSELSYVVQNGVTALYGPPMTRPDVALVSFQGAAGDQSPSRRAWPDRLLYLQDDFRFGRRLRKEFRTAGIAEMLAHRTVAMAACFPEAPASESKRWMGKADARAQWREFSTDWVKRMMRAMRPRAILVFGQKASMALGLEDIWRDRELRKSGRHEVEGCPAILCHHLSQGCGTDEMQACLRKLKQIVASSEGA